MRAGRQRDGNWFRSSSPFPISCSTGATWKQALRLGVWRIPYRRFFVETWNPGRETARMGLSGDQFRSAGGHSQTGLPAAGPLFRLPGSALADCMYLGVQRNTHHVYCSAVAGLSTEPINSKLSSAERKPTARQGDGPFNLRPPSHPHQGWAVRHLCHLCPRPNDHSASPSWRLADGLSG